MPETLAASPLRRELARVAPLLEPEAQWFCTMALHILDHAEEMRAHLAAASDMVQQQQECGDQFARVCAQYQQQVCDLWDVLALLVEAASDVPLAPAAHTAPSGATLRLRLDAAGACLRGIRRPQDDEPSSPEG